MLKRMEEFIAVTLIVAMVGFIVVKDIIEEYWTGIIMVYGAFCIVMGLVFLLCQIPKEYGSTVTDQDNKERGQNLLVLGVICAAIGFLFSTRK